MVAVAVATATRAKAQLHTRHIVGFPVDFDQQWANAPVLGAGPMAANFAAHSHGRDEKSDERTCF
jgi:hypothetical protein